MFPKSEKKRECQYIFFNDFFSWHQDGIGGYPRSGRLIPNIPETNRSRIVHKSRYKKCYQAPKTRKVTAIWNFRDLEKKLTIWWKYLDLSVTRSLRTESSYHSACWIWNREPVVILAINRPCFATFLRNLWGFSH